MEQSPFLDMSLLHSNDYADHWDVPVNGNFTALDDHLDNLATELIGIPGSPTSTDYTSKLKGNHDSLKDRIDSIEDPIAGGLIFNNDDLTTSLTSRKPWTGIEENIHTRIERCEEDHYVEDAVKGSVAAGHMLIPYAKKRLDRSGGIGVEGRRYSSGAATDLDNFYFRNKSAASMITHTAVNTLTIDGLGLMQIGGNLFHHTRSCTVPVIDAGSHVYCIEAVSSDAAATADCQLIRTSLSAGMSAGSFTLGGSTFSASDTANIDDPDIGNNNWLPIAGQILRVTHSGITHDYQIKTVPGGTGAIEIWGKFDIDSSTVGGSCDWEIYDLTQPCINVTQLISANMTQTVMQYSHLKIIPSLVLAFVHVEAGNIRVTHPAQTDWINKSLLLTPTFDAHGFIGAVPGTVEDFGLDGVSAANIKDIKVITVERIHEIAVPDKYHYITSINPKRRVTLAGVGDFFLDSFHVTHYGTIASATGTDIMSYGVIGPGGGYTVIRLVHPDYGDDGATNTYWSYDPDMVICPQDGYELMYLGILVELI